MMLRVFFFLLMIALIAIAIVVFGVIVVEYNVNGLVNDVRVVVKATAMPNQGIQALNDSATALRDSLKGKHANGDDGLLYVAHTLLLGVSQTSNVIRQTSMDERKGLKTLTDMGTGVVVDAGASVRQVGALAGSMTMLVDGLNDKTVPVLNQSIASVGTATIQLTGPVVELVTAATKQVDGLSGPVNHLDVLLSDPNWQKTLYNVQDSTAHADHSLKEVDDGLTALFNPKKQGFWRGVVIGMAKGLVPRPTFTF